MHLVPLYRAMERHALRDFDQLKQHREQELQAWPPYKATDTDIDVVPESEEQIKVFDVMELYQSLFQCFTQKYIWYPTFHRLSDILAQWPPDSVRALFEC